MDCEDIQPDVRNCARGEIRDQYLSAAKARSILGWNPVFDLNAGLRQTIKWYAEFLGERKRSFAFDMRPESGGN